MKRFTLLLAALAVVAVAPSQQAVAQNVTFHIGGGIANGIGDLSEETDMGWMGFAGLDVPIMSMPGLAVGATASYAHIPYEGDFGDATNIPALLGEVAYLFGATSPSRVKPYIRAGAGVLQHRYDPGDLGDDEESETKFGVGGGGGIVFRAAGFSPFVGAHVISGGSDTGYYTVYVGVTFGGNSASNAIRNALRRR